MTNAYYTAIITKKTHTSDIYGVYIMLRYFISAVVGYLLGSLSFAVIVSKTKFKKDIRNYGSNNAGMTNTARTFGKKAAAVVFLGDFIKPMIAALIALFLISGKDNPVGCAYIAGTAAVIGHIFPVFFGFKGGKGVASMFGVATVMSPISVPILAVPFFVTLSASKMVSLSSIISAACVPVVTFVIYKFLPFLNPLLLRGDWKIPTVCTAIIAILVIFMHRSNIERIKKGEERKIGSKKG